MWFAVKALCQISMQRAKSSRTGAQRVKQWNIVHNSMIAGRFSDSFFNH